MDFYFILFLAFLFSLAFFWPILDLALVDQAGLELTEIRLPLPPKGWD